MLLWTVDYDSIGCIYNIPENAWSRWFLEDHANTNGQLIYVGF